MLSKLHGIIHVNGRSLLLKDYLHALSNQIKANNEFTVLSLAGQGVGVGEKKL